MANFRLGAFILMNNRQNQRVKREPSISKENLRKSSRLNIAQVQQLSNEFHVNRAVSRMDRESSQIRDAVKSGNMRSLQDHLRSNGSNVHFIVQKDNLLHLACSFGHEEVVQELISQGAPVAAQAPDSKRAPLHEACLSGSVNIIRQLIIAAGNLDELDGQDRDGLTPVHICAIHGQVDCLKLLAESGANLVMEDKNQMQPSHWAARRNHVEVLSCLFDYGVDMEAVCAQKKTPLHYAAQFGGVESLRCLVQRGCDVTLSDDKGRQPIHFAAWKNHLDCLRFINAQGIALDVRQNDGRTPAHLAAFYGSNSCLHWILERKIDPNLSDESGNTPAHLANLAGKPECFSCLLEHGASQEVLNSHQEVPLETARRSGHPLAMEKAVKGGTTCPFCHQKRTRFQWEKDHPVPPVVKELNRCAEFAYKSPLGSYEGDMRRRARDFNHQRHQKQQARGSVTGGGVGTTGAGRGGSHSAVIDRTRSAAASYSGSPTVGRPASAALFLTQTGPGYRDLLTKYYGKHIEGLPE